MTDNNPSGVPVLSLSDAALAKVLKLRAEEPEAESLALWVEISGVEGARTATTCTSRRPRMPSLTTGRAPKTG